MSEALMEGQRSGGTITARVFVVGCERSGTTLLQSMLAANSHVASFPESHFYARLFSGHRLLFALGIASRRARLRWNDFLAEIGHSDMQSRLPKLAIGVGQYSRAFVKVLDSLALSQGKTVWVEKTPDHLHFVDQIEKLVGRARFVHIMRDGVDNIASLYDVGIRYPKTWGSHYGSVDRCIRRWVEDRRMSKRCASRPHHLLIEYERLVADPGQVLPEVCRFIGVPFEDTMLTDYAAAAGRVVLTDEPWKASVSGPIRSNARAKFCEVFDADQRRYILERLADEAQEEGVPAKGTQARGEQS